MFLGGPVDGALYQEIMQDYDGMWTIAQNTSLCVCGRNRKIEQERWKECVLEKDRKREELCVCVHMCVCERKVYST